MKLYKCWYVQEEWICYVFAETRGKAKYLFTSFWHGFGWENYFVDVRSKFIGITDAIEIPTVVDDEKHKDYPAVLSLCDGFNNEGYE